MEKHVAVEKHVHARVLSAAAAVPAISVALSVAAVLLVARALVVLIQLLLVAHAAAAVPALVRGVPVLHLAEGGLPVAAFVVVVVAAPQQLGALVEPFAQ